MDRRARSRSKEPALASAAQKNYLVGIGLLVIVVLLWTSSNYLIQDLLEGGYDKPFLLTYLSTSTFALYLIPYLVRERSNVLKWIRQTKRRSVDRSLYTRLAVSDAQDNASPLRPLTHSHSSPLSADKDAPLTTRETASLALTFSVLWFIANWSVNASLGYTSVASTTILTTTSGFFTLAIGALFRVEKFTIVKCAAVMSCFVGVVLVSLSDSKKQPLPPSSPAPPSDFMSTLSAQLGALFGDALALFSALFYAIYVVFLKVRIGSEERIDMQLFFGFIGLFTFALYWPFGLLLQLLGVETLAAPHGTREVVSVLINCSITFASDYLFLLAMLKTTPLVVTIGLSMTIPAALTGDAFLGRPAAVQALFGGVLVLVGFVVVGWDDSKNATPPEAATAADEERSAS